MTKNLLLYLLIFIPSVLFAQSEAGIIKDFNTDIKNLTTTLQFNDKVNIMEVNTDNEHFDLIAVDANMNILWKTTIDGFSLSLGKFKGKVLAIASTNHSNIKGSNNTYKGFLLEPSTGKIIIDKVIYDDQQEYTETPFFFHAKDGSFFKLALRQTNLKRKLHVALPGPFALLSLNKLENDATETKDITVIDFDENLQSVNTFHPAVSDDVFITMECNFSGSLFIAWYRKDGKVNVLKYPFGKKEATAQINQDLQIHNGASKRDAAEYFQFFPSVKNPDFIYYSILYKNIENDPELTVSKLDFAKNSKQAITEVFTKSHIKEIEKSYIPFNKKLDKPDNISGSSLQVRSITELNDRLLVFMSTRIIRNSGLSYVVSTMEGSILINGYDLNLNTKYQQIFPSTYTTMNQFFETGYHQDQNTLNIIANLKTDGALYGSMDIATGQWNNIVLLPKKKLSGADVVKSADVLWYQKGFIIPYLRPRGMMKTSRDISLQQFTY